MVTALAWRLLTSASRLAAGRFSGTHDMDVAGGAVIEPFAPPPRAGGQRADHAPPAASEDKSFDDYLADETPEPAAPEARPQQSAERPEQEQASAEPTKSPEAPADQCAAPTPPQQPAPQPQATPHLTLVLAQTVEPQAQTQAAPVQQTQAPQQQNAQQRTQAEPAAPISPEAVAAAAQTVEQPAKRAANTAPTTDAAQTADAGEQQAPQPTATLTAAPTTQPQIASTQTAEIAAPIEAVAATPAKPDAAKPATQNAGAQPNADALVQTQGDARPQPQAAAQRAPAPDARPQAQAASEPLPAPAQNNASQQVAPPAQTQTAQNTQQAAPVAQPAAAHTPVAAQIGREVVRRFNGENTRFEMRLDPPELGRIDVRLEVTRDHKVTAVVAADNPQALADLVRGARDLEQALQSAGLELTEGGLSFDLNQGGERFADADRNSGASTSGRAQSSDGEPAASTPARPIGFERWRGVRVDIMA